MRRLRLGPSARRDLEGLLAFSGERFGRQARARYEQLIATALRDLAADPGRLGVAAHPDLPPSILVYHLRHSRRRPGDRVGDPRHFIVFRLVGDDRLEVIRVLHDAMDIARHVEQP